MVVVDHPETMNLLGLLMGGVLVDTLATRPRARRALAQKGDVCVRAGDMAVTLRFDGERVTIVRDDLGTARARVQGTVAALLGVVADGGIVRRVLGGEISVGGNVLALWRMLPLIDKS